jgi:hypothetical protein
MLPLGSSCVRGPGIDANIAVCPKRQLHFSRSTLNMFRPNNMWPMIPPTTSRLACPDCNRYKGPNLTTIDTQAEKVIRLFHPRVDMWEDHFEFRGALIVGRTDIGAATARLLQMNNEERVRVRAELLANREI